MLSSTRWALSSLLLFSMGFAAAQEKNARKESRPPANAVDVRFADDSTVKMVLEQNHIEVITRYGKLRVPAEEMHRIEFGMRIPEESAARIAAAVKALGSDDFKKRDGAAAELLGLRELAYPSVQRATRSSDPEVARRAEEIIKTMAEKVPAEKLHLPQHDTVVTADFTIIGQVEATALKARSPYFGESSLKLSEVRSMRWLANGKDVKLTLDATRYGGQQELWMDTGFDVRPGMTLGISASGSVDLMPQQPGAQVMNPDGINVRALAQLQPGQAGIAFAAGGFAGPAVARGGRQAGSRPGALVGRVGDNGRLFIVGSKYEANATEQGKLYLRILPSPYGQDSSGSYEVRISSGR